MTIKNKLAKLSQTLMIIIFLLISGIADVIALTTEERIENLELLLSRVKLEEVDGKMSYIFGPENCVLPDGTSVTPCGVNVYVRNGDGATNPTSNNGLGNIIVGSNRAPATAIPQRDATHSIIVGDEHQYDVSSSLLFGYQNTLESGVGALVAGRGHSSANDLVVATNILGGIENSASLATDGIVAGSTILGGAQSIAMGDMCSVGGGFRNICNASHSQVVGGEYNRADAQRSSVGGGYANQITAT